VAADAVGNLFTSSLLRLPLVVGLHWNESKDDVGGPDEMLSLTASRSDLRIAGPVFSDGGDAIQ